MSISRADNDRIWRQRSDETDSTAPTTSARRETPHASRDRGLGEGTIAQHLESRPASTEYLAFLTHLASPRTATDATASAAGVASVASVGPDAVRDAAVQKKLDAVRDAFSGPYVVNGQEVAARPMFRMTTHDVGRKTEALVDQIAQGARTPSFSSRMGQPAPKELVKVTQALIDAGRLPAGPGDLATRIRKMQWDHGIGVDCAGYAKHALVGCAPRVPKMYGPGMESFRDLDRERSGAFAKLSLEGARPGDLITLDAPNGGFGHNVVVYSHTTAKDAKHAVLDSTDPSVNAFLSTPGPHHIFEVDSSWGAGAHGAEEGGYRRDTWLYDASTKKWGSFDADTKPGRFVTSMSGPAHDSLHGVYRPR